MDTPPDVRPLSLATARDFADRDLEVIPPKWAAFTGDGTWTRGRPSGR